MAITPSPAPSSSPAHPSETMVRTRAKNYGDYDMDPCPSRIWARPESSAATNASTNIWKSPTMLARKSNALVEDGGVSLATDNRNSSMPWRQNPFKYDAEDDDEDGYYSVDNKRSLMCTICHKFFESDDELKQHTSIQLKCPLCCDNSHTNTRELALHIINAHTAEDDNRESSKQETHPISLPKPAPATASSTSVHKVEPKFSCATCSTSFVKRKKLDRHLANKLRCPICCVFLSDKKLQLHILSTHGRKQDKHSQIQTDLQMRDGAVNTAGPVPDTGGLQTTSGGGLSSQQTTIVGCRQCHFRWKTVEQAQQNHLFFQAHEFELKPIAPTSQVKTKPELQWCTVCDLSFTGKKSEHNHKEYYTRTYGQSSIWQRFMCEACQIILSAPTVVDHMIDSDHLWNCKWMKLYCGVCDVTFLNSAAIAMHKLGHPAHTTPESIAPASVDKNQRIPPGDMLAVQCDPCSMTIFPSVLDDHQRNVKHIVNCVKVGLFCYICPQKFMNLDECREHAQRTGHSFPAATKQRIEETSAKVQIDPVPGPTKLSPEQGGKIYTKKLSTCGVCKEVTTDLKNHYATSEKHIAVSKQKGLYCQDCKLCFLIARKLKEHTNSTHVLNSSNATAEQNYLYCWTCHKTCKSRSKLEKHYKTQHPGRKIDPVTMSLPEQAGNATEPVKRPQRRWCRVCIYSYTETTEEHCAETRHINKCIQVGLQCTNCKAVFQTSHKLREHTNSVHVLSQENATEEQNNLYCWPCHISFNNQNEQELHEHKSHGIALVEEFRCCDCNTAFKSSYRLGKHIDNGRCTAQPRKQFHCLPCAVSFNTKKQLNRHKHGSTHRPVACMGSKKCEKRFKKIPDMIAHLESGACVSKLNRHAIEALIRARDTTHAITLPAAFAPPLQTIESISASSFMTAPAVFSTPSLYATVNEDEDYDDDVEAVYSTASYPITPSTPGGAPILTPTTTTGSIIYTPSGMTTPTLSPFMPFVMPDGRTCSFCNKTFSTPAGAQAHINSPVHAPTIYHCPSVFLEELGVGVRGKKHGEADRRFKTLSGLVLHVSHGACAGEEGWRRVLGFLEGGLRLTAAAESN